MYERVKIELKLFHSADIIRTSPSDEWKDDNADKNGWT